MKNLSYDRNSAVAYAEKWALARNPEYYSFSGIGGDCTNFASQCLLAGCGVMNYRRVTGWYYIGANNRSASWTGVKYLYDFLTGNKGAGPFGTIVEKDALRPGDIIQLGNSDGVFYHTPVVLSLSGGEIYVAAHSIDSLWRPLSSYSYDRIRCIHIAGVRAN